MNNNIFSKQRFTLAFRNDLFGNYKSWLKTLGVIFGVMLAIVLYIVWVSRMGFSSGVHAEDILWGPEKAVFSFGTFIIAIVSGSMFFSSLKSKGAIISNLMLPASQFEKYFVRWLVFVPILIVVSIAGMFLIDIIRCLATYIICGFDAPVKLLCINLATTSISDIFQSFALLLAVQSLFILGSSIWPRNSLITTALVTLLIGFVLTIIDSILFVYFAKNGDFPSQFDDNVFVISINIFLVIFTLVNYTIAYFRYKEMEIIQRW